MAILAYDLAKLLIFTDHNNSSQQQLLKMIIVKRLVSTFDFELAGISFMHIYLINKDLSK